ncbi:MAG: sigma-E factor negative regulatory protein [Rhodocyclaceae bacterium]|nr:sigma-E factor negative regulatory protein [Rhodocyclaceae bacterium]
MDEEVSALVDSALDDARAQHVAQVLGRDERLRQSWTMYHVIGECMRREPAAPKFDIAARVMQQLDTEPTVLAPQAAARKPRHPLVLPAMAAMLGICAIGWVALSLQGGLDTGPGSVTQTAQYPDGRSGLRTANISTLDAPVEGYLVAHQGVSPRTGMQGVAPYVRSVMDVDTLPAVAAR